MAAQIERRHALAQAERRQQGLIGHGVKAGRMQPQRREWLDRISEFNAGHVTAGLGLIRKATHQPLDPKTRRSRSVVRATGFSRIFFSSRAT